MDLIWRIRRLPRLGTTIAKKSILAVSTIFSILAVVTTFLPIEEILLLVNKLLPKMGVASTLSDNLKTRILLLCSLSILGLVYGFVFCLKGRNVIYQKEKTAIIVEYGDLNRYICNNENHKPYTVVIPINDHLDTVADSSKVRPNSNHGSWLKQMKASGLTENEIHKKVLDGTSDVQNNICPIGTCISIECQNVHYLLLVIATLENRVAHCPEKQYLEGMQSLLDELSNSRVNIDEPIYMPVIASGYANTDMNKSIQELTHMMAELLKFNAAAIQNPVHIVVYEKDQKDVSIFV